MSQSVVDIESTIKDLMVSLPNPVTSDKMPQLAKAINLAINAARELAESASILAKLSKERPEISHQAYLVAEVASEAATFAASVASICIECTDTHQQKGGRK